VLADEILCYSKVILILNIKGLISNAFSNAFTVAL